MSLTVQFVDKSIDIDINKLTFTEAALEDAPAIVEINNTHVNSQSNDGFLLKKLDLYELQETIRTKEERYFVAKIPSDSIVGFIELSTHFSNEIMQQLEWKDQQLREMILNYQHFYVEQIAIRKEFQRKGIGSFLYRTVLNLFPNAVFSAFVVNKPIKNNASIEFHMNHHFFEGAIYKTTNFYGFENYESILFVRKPFEDL